jgi:hypothetical protein
MKGLAIACVAPAILVSAVVLIADEPLKPGDQKAVAFLILLFLGLGGVMVIDFFGTRHRYDEQGLTYRTPWTRKRSLRWADVSELKWSLSMKWLVIRDAGGVKFRISPLLGGLDGLGRTAQQHIPRAVLDASPAGAAVLELMRRGHVFGLVMSQATPETQVRDLPPER